MAESGEAAGALVAVSFLSKPGKKNDAGETLVPLLMPPQPAPKKITAANTADNNKKFQFNFTLISIN